MLIQTKVHGLAVYMLVAVILLSINACSTVDAPVERKTSSYYKKYKKGYKRKHASTYHQVKKGETLYSIAWQYGFDYKELARKNQIKWPYRIQVGQKIRVGFDTQRIPSSDRHTKKVRASGKRISSIYKNRKNTQRNRKAAKTRQRAGTRTSVAKRKKAAADNKTTAGRLRWVWPAKGKIIQKFAPSAGKTGVDIALKYGHEIRAAEAGKVVYSGHGLTGYGLLLIIKHNNQYLSAYAHNSKLLVTEGQRVKRQQKIALAGKTAADRVKLHFEIRKNGKPVNPLRYLR